MILSQKALSFIAVAFYFFSVLSITFNELLGMPDGLSLSQIFVALIIVLAFLVWLQNRSYLIAELAFVSLLMIVIASVNIAFVGAAVNLKNILFIVFFLATSVYFRLVDIGYVVRFIYFLGAGSIFLTLFFYVFFVVLQGVSSVDFYNLMPIDKQDLTSLLSVFSAILVYRAFVFKNTRSIAELLGFTLCILLLSMKSVMISVFSVVSVILVFKGGVRYFLYLWVLVVSFFAFWLIADVIADYLPENISYFYKHFVLDENLYDWQSRRLDTFYIREYIYIENLSYALEGFRTFILGNGFNVVEGEKFVSDISRFEYIAPDYLESGYLFYFVYFGFVGLLLYFYLALKPVFKVIADKADFNSVVWALICFSFFASNMFQDNVNAVSWFLLGSCWAVYKGEVKGGNSLVHGC